MRYILKNKDRAVLVFEVGEDFRRFDVAICEVCTHDLLPISFKTTKQDVTTHLKRWIKQRRIPKHRQFMRQILHSLGIQENDPLSYAQVSLALSLNDTFWITPYKSNYLWQNFNLYDNPFSNVLAQVAFTGRSTKLKGLKTSPELTTHGMLKKCWRRNEVTGVIELTKGQIDTEAYCEYYTAQVAQSLGLNAISYDLATYQGEVVCTCELFTSQEIGFVPMVDCLNYLKYRNLEDSPQERILMLAEVLGQDFLCDLLLFDALVFNTDRHLGNYGMLIDNETNTLLSPAPIFDNGMAFLGQVSQSELADIPAFFEGVDSNLNITFNEQLDLAARPRHVNKLEQLREFAFKRHSCYNLPEEWLQAGERFIQQRSQEIIEIIQTGKTTNAT